MDSKKRNKKSNKKRHKASIDLDKLELEVPRKVELGQNINCKCCSCGKEFEISMFIYNEFKGECPECDSMYFEAKHPNYPK
jgi:hypothetical protein